MILATQRPSTNVITGIIKANFPGRIAFRVSQMVDSRTILDRPGANQLIGKGDMLFSFNGEIDRVQCAFISTEEVFPMAMPCQELSPRATSTIHCSKKPHVSSYRQTQPQHHRYNAGTISDTTVPAA